MNRTLKLGGFVLAALFLINLAACREKIPLKLTARQTDIADTLFLRRAKVVRPMLDSVCEANFDARVKRAVDSMLVLRRIEEEQLRERIRQIEDQ